MNKPAYPYPEGTNTWIEDWPFVATVGDYDVHRDGRGSALLVVPKGHYPIWYLYQGSSGWSAHIPNCGTSAPDGEVRVYVEALHQLTR